MIPRSLYICLCLALSASAVFFLETRLFNFDAIETIHSAWKISVGERIYVDFDQPRNPGIYFLLAPIISYLGDDIDTIITISYLMVIFALMVICLSYKIAELVFDKASAKLTALILASLPWFAMSAFVIRADIIMLFFELLSLFFLLKFLNDKRKIYLVISAVCISIAFIFIQKAVFFAAILGLLMLKNYFNKKISFKEIAIYIFSAVCVQVLFWIFLYFQGSLSEYFFFNFTYVLERQADLKVGGNRKELLIEMLFNWQAFTLLILGIFAYFFIKNIKNNNVREIGIAGTLLLLTIFIVGRAYEQYYLPAMPFFAVIIAYGITQVQSKAKAIFMLCGLVMLGIVNNVYWGFTQYEKRKFQLEKINYVLSKTNIDDPIYDGSNHFNVFRKDLDFFWYGGVGFETIHRVETYKKFREYDYDIYELIKTKRPKIISHYFVDTDSVDWLLWRYRRNEKFDDVYELIPNNTGFDFWTSFVDDKNLGSYVTPSNSLFNEAGEVEVEMLKADSNGKYNSYAGLELRFDFNNKPIDLSSKEAILLTYKSSQKFYLALSQKGVNAGAEHNIILDETDGKFITKRIEFNEFSQSSWVQKKTDLDSSKLTGVKFMPVNEGEKIKLNIRKVEFQN